MEKPFLADALATMLGALTGTTTAGAYIGSGTGLKKAEGPDLPQCDRIPFHLRFVLLSGLLRR